MSGWIDGCEGKGVGNIFSLDMCVHCHLHITSDLASSPAFRGLASRNTPAELGPNSPDTVTQRQKAAELQLPSGYENNLSARRCK